MRKSMFVPLCLIIQHKGTKKTGWAMWAWIHIHLTLTNASPGAINGSPYWGKYSICLTECEGNALRVQLQAS